MPEELELDDVDEDKPLPRKTVEAQEQADDLGGFARSGIVVAHNTGEKFKVRSVFLLDDDELVAYETLHFEMNQCDRWPDTEQPLQRIVTKNPDGTEMETEIGAHTVRGDFIQPYQKDGKRIDPPYAVRLAEIVLGAENFKRFKAGGGRSAEVPEVSQEVSRRIEERRAADSKSRGSNGRVAAGANGDRSGLPVSESTDS